MIIQRVTESQFIDAFKSWDTYKNNFSYEGLKALYEELEEVAECSDSGTFELDVVAICCDYIEFENFKETFSIMTRIAFEADAQQHHPEWTNVYNTLSITLSTHDAGGVTEKDFKMAETIENLIQTQ